MKQTKTSITPPYWVKTSVIALFSFMGSFLIAQNGPPWKPSGNNASNGDFIGTTNSIPLLIKTNNTTRFTFDSNGDIIFNSLASANNYKILTIDVNGKLTPVGGTAIKNFIENNGLGLLSKTGTNYYLPNGNLGIGTVPNSNYKLDVAGNTQITGSLKLSNLAGTGYAIVYTDSAGNLLKTIPNPGGGNGIGSTPCLPNTIPWFEGGNNVDLTVNGSNYAGTCNNVDFILKSNNVSTIFNKPSGSIGFGANFTSNPGDPLQFIFSNGLTRCKGNNAYGGPMFVFNGPTSPNGDWGVEYTGGTAVANSGLNFWKPYGSTNANNNILFLHDNNKVGIGTDNPSARLTIDAWADDGVKILSDPNKNAISVSNKSNSLTVFNVASDGKTIIGDKTQTSGPHTDALLTINGKIVGKSCFIRVVDWADYVFDKDYQLLNLYDEEKYYLTNKHLPGVPSEKEVLENGIDLGEMNKILLKKIEEMTIRMVKMQKEIDAIKQK